MRIGLVILALAVVGLPLAAQEEVEVDLLTAELAAIDLADEATVEGVFKAHERLEQVNKMMRREKYFEAREALRPLIGSPYFQDEVRRMMYKINAERQNALMVEEQENTTARVLSEAMSKFVLPDTYQQTVGVTPEYKPLAPPPGPMEDLVNRKVNIDLVDATIEDIIMTLSEMDDMNIISDQGLESEQTLTIKLHDVPLRELLEYVMRNMGIDFQFGENVIWITQASEEPELGGAQLELAMFELQSGFVEGDDGAEDTLLNMLESFVMEDSPEGAKMDLNRDHNVLMMLNTRENLRSASSIVDRFDQVPKQVLIEASYMTISQNELFLLGTSFNNLNFEQGFIPKFNFDSEAPLPEFGNNLGGEARVAISGIIDNVTYNAILETIQQTRSARTLSAPKLLVVNNQSADIFRGETLRYFSEFEQQSNVVAGDNPVIANAVVPVGDAEELELGITLQVTANVGNDMKTIMLSLTAEISEFLEFQSLAEGVSLPRTFENSLTTTASVNSGRTIVLGGMITAQSSTTVSKIPLLGDMPVLGKLFRKFDTNESPDHLLIFVKAIIVDPDGRFNIPLEEEERP
ncbi:MAG: type II secretion system protein GspD [Lentisphaeria bacterium]